MRSTPRAALAALAIAAALVPFTAAAAAAPSEPAKGQTAPGASAAGSAAPGDVVIATVDGQVVTRKDLDEALTRLPEQYRSLAATPQGRKQVLDNLILTKLLYARARAQGMPDDPAVKAQVQAYAEQAAIVAMIQQVADRAAANVPESDLRAYYDTHRDQFLKSQEQVRASHILVDTEAQARQLREEILGGRDFAEAARASSKDEGSAGRGGDLGFFTKDRMVPAFADAAFRLEKPGDLSPVVKTQFGYHIIRLEEKRPAEQASFDDVKDRIAEQLREERQQRAVEQYVEDLRAKAKISIDESRLAE
ncbi:MAG TPA: peptidylprolyl isomerase [Thermodesulfobacteriota bacterium]